MGITRDSTHKRRATGGRARPWHDKRKHSLGRPAANTKLGESRVRPLRVRGGNMKYRAIRLDHGNFSWGSEVCSRKVRVVDVVYNATSNELVRTKTLVKGAIIQIDSTPFRQWYEQHYGIHLGKKSTEEPAKVSRHAAAKKAGRAKDRVIDPHVAEQFNAGRLYARISSRPGQCGRVDGYILEGEELAFYTRKMHQKKAKK
eukprot:TRINITY_DN4_c0_g1_i1.p1 TRINITY_DN4_c0_g1~~TRINITY_DN4_c0_g1_i1.p1  ORF type:complete len:212 (-),score=78.04 TRINITY_DN4_c0_g1_i1:59-661(-)